ncbi:hypothetical protein OHU17_35155 [Streptomyces goshikiensis]|uniref:Uncharacterized protein n=1 Tax=Streptomyces goshikiensis TaxID=1942 RepID=A0ABZ1RW04_9ACTN|nr:hypothetical protein [Streptomyces goshikiensis]
MDVLPVLLIGDPLEIHRRLQHPDGGVLAAGGVEDFGVGEASAGRRGGGQDDRRVQGPAGCEGVGELHHMFLFHVPGADGQPRKHLLSALVRFQHELAEVGGDGGQVRHRPDPALREKPGEAGPETGGEDLAVVTPHAATQLQRDGARHLQDCLVGAVQEQDPARHQVDEDQAVGVGAEGDQPRVGCLDIGELLAGEELCSRVQGSDPGRGPGRERGYGRRGFVQQ